MKKPSILFLTSSRILLKAKVSVLFLLSGMCLTSCAYDARALSPNHIGITPSVEWEIQHGVATKTKPKIQSSLDWNF